MRAKSLVSAWTLAAVSLVLAVVGVTALVLSRAGGDTGPRGNELAALAALQTSLSTGLADRPLVMVYEIRSLQQLSGILRFVQSARETQEVALTTADARPAEVFVAVLPEASWPPRAGPAGLPGLSLGSAGAPGLSPEEFLKLAQSNPQLLAALRDDREIHVAVVVDRDRGGRPRRSLDEPEHRAWPEATESGLVFPPGDGKSARPRGWLKSGQAMQSGL